MSFNIVLGVANIKTTIAKEDEVDECIQALVSNSKNHKRLIGLDTIPCLNRLHSSKEVSVDLLQLCDGSQCVIFKLKDFDRIPKSLYSFLSLPSYTFVGFGIKDSLALLRQEYGFVCKNSFEAVYSEKHISLIPFNLVCIPPSLSDLGGEDLIKLAVSNAYTAFVIASSRSFP